MKRIYIVFALLFAPFIIKAQDQQVYTIQPVADSTLYYAGDLATGTMLTDLAWAWSSQNACFPETQKSKFTGNHVFYTCEIPAHSEMEITVIPDDPTANFSIYAYEVGVNNTSLVPNLPSCIRCEAEHKWDRPKRGKTQDHSRTVKDILAINSPYRVVIGVVGADGLTVGTYKLKIVMRTK